jgi:hypothetical protein
MVKVTEKMKEMESKYKMPVGKILYEVKIGDLELEELVILHQIAIMNHADALKEHFEILVEHGEAIQELEDQIHFSTEMDEETRHLARFSFLEEFLFFGGIFVFLEE